MATHVHKCKRSYQGRLLIPIVFAVFLTLIHLLDISVYKEFFNTSVYILFAIWGKLVFLSLSPAAPMLSSASRPSATWWEGLGKASKALWSNLIMADDYKWRHHCEFCSLTSRTLLLTGSSCGLKTGGARGGIESRVTPKSELTRRLRSHLVKRVIFDWLDCL